MRRAVERGLQRRTEEAVPYVGLDEKSFLRGHNYASVTDITGSRVLEVQPGRKPEDAKKALSCLSPAQREGVRAVAIDMWPGYMSAAPEMLSNADIVHDKFHISKYCHPSPRSPPDHRPIG